jgi:hypothetical protein
MSLKVDVLKAFLTDTDRHQLQIIQDDGVHRHIVLCRPGSSIYLFGLVTWPGHLTVYGDAGTMTFRRLDDMFDFFRTDHPEADLSTNPDYWSGKSEGLSGTARANCFEWDAEGFENNVNTAFDGWKASQEFDPEELADASSESAQLVEQYTYEINQILNISYDEHEAMAMVRDMEGCYEIFGDEWYDVSARRLRPSFLWLCYAIQWGIRKYDLKKMAVAAVTKSINMRELVA